MTENITLSPSQQNAFKALCGFFDDSRQRVFILKGYAGTGKTTLIRYLIDWLDSHNHGYQLLASTGRAAKILSNVTSKSAKTVHSQIYSFTGLSGNLDDSSLDNPKVEDSGQYLLNFALQVQDEDNEVSCYIIDESSMVSDIEDKLAVQAVFGSGRLLSDLLNACPKAKFVFVGDPCQLPPINQAISPALSVSYFATEFGMSAKEIELTEIVRQPDGNDLIQSSKRVRQLFNAPPAVKWAKFPFRGYRNIHILPSQAQLIQAYIADVKQNGYNAATLLCSTNRECNMMADLLRPTFGIYSSEISKGDLLLVTQNNNETGLMNGDLVIVESLGHIETHAGLRFQQISVRELYTNRITNSLLMLDVLYANTTNLSQSQQRELIIDFCRRMRNIGIKPKQKAFNEYLAKDPCLNALRAVYGYALTCHKAQGGEWERVYLDIARHVPAMAKPYVYQWIYTAMTRAKKELFVVDDFWVG